MRIPTTLAAIAVLTVGLIARAQTGWVDPSSHRERLVRVEADVDVEVLDWGGAGRTLVLLAQLGQTAHIYDDWAPRLARSYRVVGVTRRGYGASSAPATGYSAARLGRDIVAVLDAEKILRPVLVGNQFAGEELFWIGAQVPARVAGLVYLDAAYDRSNIGAEISIARRIPPPPPPGPDDMASAQAMTRWASKGGVSIPESEVRQMGRFGGDGRLIGERTPAAVRQQILAGLTKADYSKIQAPVLAIYAKPTSAESFPGCVTDNDAARGACRELYDWTLQHLSDSERSVRTIRSNVRVLELPGANPFSFLSNEGEVRSAIDQFVESLPR